MSTPHKSLDDGGFEYGASDGHPENLDKSNKNKHTTSEFCILFVYETISSFGMYFISKYYPCQYIYTDDLI